jgi:hypothetical protein
MHTAAGCTSTQPESEAGLYTGLLNCDMLCHNHRYEEIIEICRTANGPLSVGLCIKCHSTTMGLDHVASTMGLAFGLSAYPVVFTS